MADFNEILESLRQTQSFFKRETEEYKNFRDSLSALNKAMLAAGNRGLSAAEVQSLRELTAKTRKAWGKYLDQLGERINEAADRNDPGLLSQRDNRRLGILAGMTGLLDRDLLALRNADPREGLTLEQIIMKNRGLTSDIRGKNIVSVRGGVSTRMVLEAGGKKGVFTEDYSLKSEAQARQEYGRKHPAIADFLERMAAAPEVYDVWVAGGFGHSPEEMAENILNKSFPYTNQCVESLMSAINKWGIPFPAELANQEGTVWFENPEFVRQFSDTFFHLPQARADAGLLTVAQFEEGKNVPRRNAAMSAVADRLGMPELAARSKVMKITSDEGEKTGVFMEWADGKDLDRLHNTGKFDADIYGHKMNFNSAGVLKAAANLQVLDYICGNVDRHQGNMLYKFEDINGVRTLTGITGIDNDASFGLITAEKGEGDLAGPASMRVITRSAAETVLALTEDELKYSLYGLVDEKEIEFAWARTKLLQEQIKTSLKTKWKNDSDIRTDIPRILDDDSPVWEKLDVRELRATRFRGEMGGVFGVIAKAEGHFRNDDRNMGTEYQDHTREGVRTGYYKETEESSNYGCRTELIFPEEREDRTDRDVFGLYRNRETLHEDEDALDRGEAFFNAVFNDRRNRMTIPYGKIQEDLGIRRGVEDIIYIDGLQAREYVK